MLRAVTALRMTIKAGDKVALLDPHSCVIQEELELRDRGELLRWLALSSVQLDIVLSVIFDVINYKLLKSGDVEKNPGPGNLDYNSVDNSQILDEDDLSDVIEEVVSIRSLFYQLGRCLKLKLIDLDSVRDVHRSNGDNEQAFQSVLLFWLNQRYNVERFGPPTWRMLVRAVDMESGGNDHGLAKQIASRHPSEQGQYAISTTKIRLAGSESPEFNALQRVHERLTVFIALNPGKVALRLFESRFLPNPPKSNEDSSTYVTSIMNCVKHNGMAFYRFLGILNTLGTDADSELAAIHEMFCDTVDSNIKFGSDDDMKADAAFLSFSSKKCFETSVDAREFTGTLYSHLDSLGCNPWMDADNLGSCDYFSVSIFKTLQKCKAFIPIVTRGYAQSLWCMRELYYAKFTKSAQVNPVVIEDGWQCEDVGKWLEKSLGKVKYTSIHKQDIDRVASKIAEALGKSPAFKNEYDVDITNVYLCEMEWIEGGQVKMVRIYDESKYMWQEIGEILGINHGILDGIGHDVHDERDRVIKVLGKWQENACGLPHYDQYPRTWGGLLKLLDNSGLGQLARKVHKALLQQKNSTGGLNPRTGTPGEKKRVSADSGVSTDAKIEKASVDVPAKRLHDIGAPVEVSEPTTEHEYNASVTNTYLSRMEWTEDGKEKAVRIYDESSHKWRKIGENLGIDPSVLDGIGQDGYNVRDRVIRVLGKWQENACGLPHSEEYPKSWRGLINLLNKSDLGELAETVHKALLQQEQPSRAPQLSTRTLGQIADMIYKWEGRIADELGLTAADVDCIKTKHPSRLALQTRQALMTWKMRLGNAATPSNLISVFESAGCKDLADLVKKLTTDLTKDDLEKVNNAVRGARSQWYPIGLALEIDPNDLDFIKDVNCGSPEKCLTDVLKKFLRQVDPKPSWKRLADAMALPGVGRGDIAADLRTQYW